MLRKFVHYGLYHWGSDEQGVNTTRNFLLEALSFFYRYVPVSSTVALLQPLSLSASGCCCGVVVFFCLSSRSRCSVVVVVVAEPSIGSFNQLI